MQLYVSVLAHMLPKSDRELPMDGGSYRLHLAGRFLVSKSFELFARVNNTAARLGILHEVVRCVPSSYGPGGKPDRDGL
jgi:hypothetical protein